VDQEILYVADPMCSWCWGFAPVIEKIEAEFGDRATLGLVLGGLRAGNTEVLSEEKKRYSLEHWHRVHDLTQQPFNFAFNLPQGWVYDTEPACRAAVVVRELKPGATFAYFKALQRAFYVDNQDLTQPAVLASLAEPFGLEREAFSARWRDETTKRETSQDFLRAQRLGVQGFPSIVLKDTQGYVRLTSGYQRYEHLEPHLKTWLNGGLRVTN